MAVRRAHSIEVSGSRTNTGDCGGFIGSCADVDEHRRARDAERQRTQRRLASARDFETWILTIVSYDIRDPLGTIAFALAVVTVEVQNGGSIPSDVLPHIFEPFRSGGHYARRGGGVGRGLHESPAPFMLGTDGE